MNFKNFILEEGLYNFNYEVPTDNVVTLMYDFYAFSYLYNRTKHELNVNPDKHNGIMNLGSIFSPENEKDQDDKLTYILNNEVGRKLIPYLKDHLLKCLMVGIISEMRHFFNFFNLNDGKDDDIQGYLHDETDDLYDDDDEMFISDISVSFNYFVKYRIKNDEDLHEYLFYFLLDRNINKNFCKILADIGYDFREKGCTISNLNSKLKSFSNIEIVKNFKDIYNLKGWYDEFGGKEWANICQGYIDLYNAENFDKKLVQIDHIYDLQHNTGSALNKVEEYEIFI